MKRVRLYGLFLLYLLLGQGLSAQQDAEKVAEAAEEYMQKAEEALAENDMAAAEAFYRQAIAKDPSNAAARYNLGNLYYQKDITGEAVERHNQSANVAEEKSLKHKSYHNQGNAYMKQKKYKEAVEAYKNALRNEPGDDETRYNLALAKKLLEEEKKGGGDENKEDQKKDQQDQKKDQKQENKDQEGDQGEKEKKENGKPEENDKGGEQENKDKKEGADKKENEGTPQDQKNKKDQGQQEEQEQQKKPQPTPGQLSPQQVKNLLEAMGNEEKKVRDKINAKKVKGAKTQTEKDW